MYRNYWLNKEWTYEDLLARYATKNSNTGCYEWHSYKSKKGYGVLRVEIRTWKAHRFAYTLVHGEIVKYQQVQHKCNNPPCINVQHLVLGLPSDNVKYMIRSGRRASTVGEKNGNSKLKVKSVEWIRKMRQEGWTILEISILYGVSKSTISEITRGSNWKI
jgi:hypothetical protein